MYECDYHYSTEASSTGQIASSSCAISTSTPPLIATSSDIVIVPTFTAGEVLICFFLFALILILLGRGVLAALDRIKTKKTVLGYSGGDVEIRHDL